MWPDPNDMGGGALVIGAMDVVLGALALAVMYGRSRSGRFTRTRSGVTECPERVEPNVLRIDRVVPAVRKADNNEAEVTLHGSGFLDGMRVSFGGAEGRVLRGLTNNQARVMSPGGLQGPVAVRAWNTDGSQDSKNGAYEYVVQPDLTGISHARGPLGGRQVTLTGTDLHQSVEVFVEGQQLQNVNVDRRDAQTVVIDVPARRGPGTVRITVRNPARQTGLHGVDFEHVAPPRVDSVAVTQGSAPNTAIGASAGGETVTIRGANFDGQATVRFGNAAVPVNDYVTRQAQAITVRTPAQAAGGVQVRVTNLDNQYGEVAFTYADAPVVQAVSVTAGAASSAIGTASADIAGNETVQIDGASFDANATVRIGGANAAVTDNSQVPNRLVVTSVQRPAGNHAVEVRNPNGQQSNGNVVLAYAAPPVVNAVLVTAGPLGSALNTASANIAGNETVRIDGTNFDANAAVQIGGANAAVTDNSQVPNRLIVTTPQRLAGVHGVVVSNPNQQRSAQAVALTYASPPTVQAINRQTGSTAGGDVIRVTGAGFVATPAVSFGGTAAQAVQFVDATALDVTTPAHAVQTVDIDVTNPNQQLARLAGRFTFIEPPLIVAVVPNLGPLAGDLPFTIYGRHLAGSTVRFGGVQAQQVVATATRIDGRIPARIQPANVRTSVDVVVTGAGVQTTFTNGFTFGARAPKRTVIYPPNEDRASMPTHHQGNAQQQGVVAGYLTSLHEQGELADENVGLAQGTGRPYHRHLPGMRGLLWVRLQDDPRVHQVLDLSNVRGVQGDPNNYQCNLLNGIPGGYWFPHNVNAGTHANALAQRFAGNPAIATAVNQTPQAHAVYPATGSTAGATTLTIYGNDLGHVTSVLIDGQAVVPNAVAAGQVTVDAPAHNAGAVDVEVRTATGNSSRLANAFTYAALAFQDVRPARAAAAGGDVVYLRGAGFRDGHVQVQVDNVVMNAVDVISPSVIAVTTAAHAVGLVDVAVTDTGTNATLPIQNALQFV